MTDPRTFTLSLTQQERYTVLFALGAYSQGAPIKTETFIFPKLDELMALCAKIMDAKPDQAPTTAHALPRTQNGLVALGPLVPLVAELRDRWQRNKKGEEAPFPEDCETVYAELLKAEPSPTREGKPRWKVTWPRIGGGFMDASCFDEKLFPFLANRVKQKTTLYVMRSGKYLNVVGVRA